jgi:hypothetical protein
VGRWWSNTTLFITIAVHRGGGDVRVMSAMWKWNHDESYPIMMSNMLMFPGLVRVYRHMNRHMFAHPPKSSPGSEGEKL